MKILLIVFFASFVFVSHGQSIYLDSIHRYQQQYVTNHEVVKDDDKKMFHFYPANEKYKVVATLEMVPNGKWFTMETSGTIRKTFRVFAILHFSINDTPVRLNLYQSQNLMQTDKYKNLLFLPFTDLTSGEQSYDAGRYIDLETTDIKDNRIEIDFNKAYNPYCAYVIGKYNCPIPPRDNDLNVAIMAGEMKFKP